MICNYYNSYYGHGSWNKKENLFTPIFIICFIFVSTLNAEKKTLRSSLFGSIGLLPQCLWLAELSWEKKYSVFKKSKTKLQKISGSGPGPIITGASG